MCRNILDVKGIVVDNILILSYYVVDDYIDVNTFTKDYVDDNNITSTVHDHIKHLIQ